jgi:hypothetical protein
MDGREPAARRGPSAGSRIAAAILVASLIVAGAIVFAFTRPEPAPEPTRPLVLWFPPKDERTCALRDGAWIVNDLGRGECVGYD